MKRLKTFFAQDTILTGIVAGVGSELGFCIVLAAALAIAGEPMGAHIRWFGGMYIPLILVLHHYARKREQLRVTKTLIVVLLATFLPFITYLLKAQIITLE